MAARNEKNHNNTTPLVYKIGDGTHVSLFRQYLDAGYDYERDGFGRLRVSEPTTLFDSNFLDSGGSAKSPLVWDELIVNTSGDAAANHNASAAMITLRTGQNDSVIRQTFNRIQYQPGKAQLIQMTGVLGTGGTGVVTQIGAYDGTNGVFWENNNGVVNLCIASSGSVTRIPQGSWNIDNLDGTGYSGLTASWNKNQIFSIEFEWLGVGGVWYGLFIDRTFRPVHFENKANNSTNGAYMSTPNLPLRYAIFNTSSAIRSINQICSTVISEGGVSKTGQLRYNDIGVLSANEIQANTPGTWYAVCGISLKPENHSRTARPVSITIANTTNGDVAWRLLYQPTLSAPLTYTDQYDSAVRFGVAAAGQTVSDFGAIVAGGYVSNDLQAQQQQIESNFSLGVGIAGSSTQFVLAVTPLAANQDVLGGMTWREQ